MIEQVEIDAARIAREVMSDSLELPVDECSADSNGALMIREGIRRYAALQSSRPVGGEAEPVDATAAAFEVGERIYREHGVSPALREAVRLSKQNNPAPSPVSADDLGWSIPANLRWLADQSGRPDYVPAGWLTGAFLIRAAEKIEALAEENERLHSALHIIASYGDKGANERLRATGSYSSFDEPGSVELARLALEAGDAH